MVLGLIGGLFFVVKVMAKENKLDKIAAAAERADNPGQDAEKPEAEK